MPPGFDSPFLSGTFNLVQQRVVKLMHQGMENASSPSRAAGKSKLDLRPNTDVGLELMT